MLWLYRGETTAAEPWKSSCPKQARTPNQSSAQLPLRAITVKGRYQGTHAGCHFLWYKSPFHICRNTKRAISAETRGGKTEVWWEPRARVIQEDQQAMKCLHFWCWNVSPSCFMLKYHRSVLNNQFQHEFRSLQFFLFGVGKRKCKGRC